MSEYAFDTGGGGSGVPDGGTTGEVLTKLSDADGEADWGALPEGTPEATAATANTLVKRDALGRARFADPSNAQDAATKAYADAAGGDTYQFSNPIGVPFPYPIDGAGPAHCVEYDGATYLKADKPLLWAVLSTSTTVNYSVNATQFKVPDWRGVVPVGKKATGAFNAAIGTVVGEEKHTQTVAELAAHTHLEFPINYAVTPQAGGTTVGGTTLPQSKTDPTSSTGSSTPFNVVQPTVIVRWFARFEDVVLAPAGSTASTSVTANAVVQRTSDGRAKAANGVAADDVITVAQMNTLLAALALAPKTMIPSSVNTAGGSASIGADGLVTFTGVSRISLNGVFDGLGADKYEIYVHYTSTGASDQRFRMRRAGVDTTSGYNYVALWWWYNGGPTRYFSFGDGYLCYSYRFGGGACVADTKLLVSRPFTFPQVDLSSVVSRSDRYQGHEFGQATPGIDFDGISLITSAFAITGTIKVVKVA